MTFKQIDAALEKAAEKEELLQLWSAFEWMSDYRMIDYKHYQYFQKKYMEVQK